MSIGVKKVVRAKRAHKVHDLGPDPTSISTLVFHQNVGSFQIVVANVVLVKMEHPSGDVGCCFYQVDIHQSTRLIPDSSISSHIGSEAATITVLEDKPHLCAFELSKDAHS